MSSDIAIKVENLSKCHQIYDNPRDRLKQFLLPRAQRNLGFKPRQYFREFWALKHVSLEIKKGETVGVIGRNGSGKSTLLQIICGTLNPSSGEVQASGRVAALLELGSGFNPEFTGRENVYMNAAILGLSQDEIDDRFDRIAGFADIGEFLDQPVKTYSSGMVVRLAFAVQAMVDPDILVVDEALAVGDEAFQRKCFSRIEALRENGATILFVSHSGATIVELCDYALLLDAGEKLAIGEPKAIVGKYQKLLNAPQDKRNAMREEIRAFGRQDAQHQLTSWHAAPSVAQKTSTENEFEEFFDPNFKPQSTIEYESRGARIESPEILTLSGKKVNCLRRGGRYRYRYKVSFQRPALSVRFGMLIKTTSGTELGGAATAPGPYQGIPFLASETNLFVEFHFTCNLNPGVYFLNAGVTGIDQEAEIYLHRVLDICMFKVAPVTDNTATAIVDFDCAAELEFSPGSLQ